MLASHSPRTPREANPATASTASRQPPKIRPRAPATARTPGQPRRPGARRSRSTSAAMPDPDRVEHVDEQRAASSGWRRPSRGPVDGREQRRTPRRAAASTGPGTRRRGRPPRAAQMSARTRRRRPRVDPRRGRELRRPSRLALDDSPAIAVRIWARSTTPTTRPPSTTRIGLSVAAATWTADRMTVSGGNAGPSIGVVRRRRRA